MPAPRKYDQETCDRAARLYQGRRRDHAIESAIESLRRVGELLDIKPQTLRGWVERAEIDAGARPGVTTKENPEIARLKKENAELRRENEIPKMASAIFRSSGAQPQTFVIVAYIDDYKQQFGVEPICRVLSGHGN